MAGENLGAARRLADPLGIVGTADGEAGDRRLRIGTAIAQRIGIVRDRRLEHAFRFGGLVREGDLNQTRACLRLEAQFEVPIRGQQIALELALTEGTRLHRPFALVVAAARELFDLLAVQTDVDLARVLGAQHVGIAVSLKLDLEDVFPIEREIMARRQSPARSQGKLFAHAIVLHEETRQVVGFEHRARVAISYGGAADLARGREVAFHQHRRDRQNVADIVKAVAGIVGGQQRGDVDRTGIDRQQFPHRVRVLGAVEAMERGASGIGLDHRQAIALGLDSADQRLVRGLLGPRHADGRHFAAAQLAQDLLPSLAIDVEMGEVQGLQVQFCPRLGTEMAAVAIDLRGLPKCLLVERCPMGGCGGRSGFFHILARRVQITNAAQHASKRG